MYVFSPVPGSFSVYMRCLCYLCFSPTYFEICLRGLCTEARLCIYSASQLHLPPQPTLQSAFVQAERVRERGGNGVEHSRAFLMTPIPLRAMLLISSMILADGTWAAD